MKSFSFEYSSLNSDGRFSWTSNYSKIFETYYLSLEIYESGEIKNALNRFRYLLKKDNKFVPVLNHLGWHYTERYKFIKAKAYYEEALIACENLIPENFSGAIPWYYSENRHYLRTLQGLGLMYVYSNEYHKGLLLLEKNLKLNSNDNQGIRFLLGDVYLLLNKHAQAEKYFKENREYTPYNFSYGALLFKQKKLLESIIQFSIGIIKNELLYRIIINDEISSFDFKKFKFQINDAIEYKERMFPIWMEKNLLNFIYQIFKSDQFQLIYEIIGKLKEKLEIFNNSPYYDEYNLKRSLKLLKEIEDYTDIIDIENANIILSQIKNKFKVE